MTTDTAPREAFEKIAFDAGHADMTRYKDGYLNGPLNHFWGGFVAAHLAQQPVAVDKSLGDDTALTQVIKSAIENLGAPCGMGLCDDSQAQYVARKVIEHFSHPATSRDDRQRTVSDWCRNAFGDRQASSLPQRGIRLLEEAIEAAQAAGCERDMSHKLVDFIFDRPPGELKQELGGIGVTLLALAAAANLSADDCETREIERVLSKSLTHFAQRNQAENDAGFEASQKKGA